MIMGFIFRILGINHLCREENNASCYFCLKLLGGEPLLGLPVVLAYPFYDPEYGQLFPFRTLCMVIALLSHVIVSLLTTWLFREKYLPPSWDFLQCFDAELDSTISSALSTPSTQTKSDLELTVRYLKSENLISVKSFKGEANPSFSQDDAFS